MDNKIYTHDTGVVIELDAMTDITSQSILQIKYRRPDGSVGGWDATVVDTTKAQYTTLPGDLDVPGEWVFQIYVVLPGWSGYGEEYRRVIYRPEVI